VNVWISLLIVDNDNDVYFTLATSDSRIGKYRTVGEQLTHKNRSIYNARVGDKLCDYVICI